MCAECDRLAGWLSEAIRTYSAAVKRLQQTPEGPAFERAIHEAREAHKLCDTCRAAIIEHDKEHGSLSSAQARRNGQTGEFPSPNGAPPRSGAGLKFGDS
jgi:hypothetical protein